MRTSRSLLTLFAALFVAPTAIAEIRYVDANLASGANDGTSWQDAFQGSAGLQAALAVAVAGDQVFAAQGTYLATQTGNRTVSFVMKTGVEIYGSFLGTESSPAERPPFGTAPSVLDGDLAGNDDQGIYTDNTHHLIRAGGTDTSAQLDGFVITGGAANGTSAGNNDRGAGILIVGPVSPILRNCRFVANRSNFGGAAGYINNGGRPTFLDCSFEDNIGGAFGGAFDIAGGGAVYFDRCRFENNTAARAGALEIFASTGVQVLNSLFRGNTATGTGGGGAIWIGSGGNPRIVSCTIVDNVSTTNAVAGLRNQGSTNAVVVNNILWGNTGPGGAQDSGNQVNAGTNVTYSIVQGGYVGTGNLAADPAFEDPANGDFSLSLDSPGIDAGSNLAFPVAAFLDLAQNPRFADIVHVPDTGVGPFPIVDIGAYETSQAPFTAVAGCFGNPATLEALSPAPVVGATFSVRILSAIFAPGFGAFFLGTPSLDAGGCGLFVPGLGELLLTIEPLLLHIGFGGGIVPLTVTVPNDAALVGLTFGLQGGYAATTPGAPLQLTNLLIGVVQP